MQVFKVDTFLTVNYNTFLHENLRGTRVLLSVCVRPMPVANKAAHL